MGVYDRQFHGVFAGRFVVYQQYISDTPTSIVSNLKNEGYTCVAMHPYFRRAGAGDRFYPNMGFDEMYFLEDFDQTKLCASISPIGSCMQSIIERYESRAANEELFIMSISMQIMEAIRRNMAILTSKCGCLG